MLQKVFHNDLVAIRKSKLTLKLNKSAYFVICLLDLSKVWMYKFYYDYIKSKYFNNSRLLFTETNILMYEIKPEGVNEDFRKDKILFDFSNYSAKSKNHDD